MVHIWGCFMGKKIFWNRRSGRDRRHSGSHQTPYFKSDDRRGLDRRLYGDNDYVLVIGNTGVDRFTLLISIPALIIVSAALIAGSIVDL